MLGSLARNTYTLIKDFLGPSVIDGEPNPVRLALAQRCYWVQSRIFRIPDRFGFISAGPPRLQVEESFVFVVVVWCISQSVIYGGFVVFVVHLMGDKPVKSTAALLCLLTISVVGMIWVHLCCSARRAPGYVWEDWKERVE